MTGNDTYLLVFICGVILFRQNFSAPEMRSGAKFYVLNRYKLFFVSFTNCFTSCSSEEAPNGVRAVVFIRIFKSEEVYGFEVSCGVNRGVNIFLSMEEVE